MLLSNKDYFEKVLYFAAYKGLVEYIKIDIIIKEYAPKEKGAPLFKYKNAIFCAFCDDLIDSDDFEKILLLLELKDF